MSNVVALTLLAVCAIVCLVGGVIMIERGEFFNGGLGVGMAAAYSLVGLKLLNEDGPLHGS
jgi:hypothetical protein